MDQRFAIPGVGAQTPLAEAAPALLMLKADPLFALEEAASGGADMDAVHDMRVASRRLRETMRLLAPLYPEREFAAWYRRVRSITRALGPVRDSDVFIDDFSRLGKGLGAGGKRTVAFMVGYRMGQRVQELADLNRKLGKLDLARSRKELRKLARSVKRTPEAKRTLAEFAYTQVALRAGVVLGALPEALPEENILQQHALRIDFKRLRYAVEVFATCYGDDFDELHVTLTAFQDALGDLHDIHVFLDMLHSPERAEAAARAGVSAADIAEVVDLLDKRAHKTFLSFTALAEKNPAGELLAALLLPLSRPVPSPEALAAAAAADEAQRAVEELSADVASSGDGGVLAADVAADADTDAPVVAATDADAAASDVAARAAEPPAVEPAVVLEPATPVSDTSMQLVDPNAQPWRSDAAGLTIEPPIVIGAEPWARAPEKAEVER
jgi:CHAD domain-containing protein